jgi:hypothetical protein
LLAIAGISLLVIAGVAVIVGIILIQKRKKSHSHRVNEIAYGSQPNAPATLVNSQPLLNGAT